MFGITNRLIFSLLLISSGLFAQVTGKVEVIDNGDGTASLRRTSTYTEPMPDTAFIAARRVEILVLIDSLNSELGLLNKLQDEWEGVTTEGFARVAKPAPAPIKIPPSVTIGQGISTGVLFAVSDTNGPLLEVLLDNRNRIIINGQRWVYDRAKKTWTIKK